MSFFFGDSICTCPLPELLRGRSTRPAPERREAVGKLKIRWANQYACNRILLNAVHDHKSGTRYYLYYV